MENFPGSSTWHLSLFLLCTMDTACIILALPCFFTSFPRVGMLWTLSPDPHMLCESPVMIDSQRETTLSQYFGMFNIILVSVWRIIMDVIWCTTKTDIHSQHSFLSHTLCKSLCVFFSEENVSATLSPFCRSWSDSFEDYYTVVVIHDNHGKTSLHSLQFTCVLRLFTLDQTKAGAFIFSTLHEQDSS